MAFFKKSKKSKVIPPPKPTTVRELINQLIGLDPDLIVKVPDSDRMVYSMLDIRTKVKADLYENASSKNGQVTKAEKYVYISNAAV